MKGDTIYMFNALWFKPEGGKEKYQEYLRAAAPFVSQYDGKSDSAYQPEKAIIGEFDADLMFIVEWPNKEAFKSFVKDPGYQSVAHLRDEAIVNSLLIRLRKIDRMS